MATNEKEIQKTLDALEMAKNRLIDVLNDCEKIGVREGNKLHSIVWDIETLQNRLVNKK